ASDPHVDSRVALGLDLGDAGDACERFELLGCWRAEEGRLERRGVRATRELPDGALDQELPVVQQSNIVADFLDLAEEVGAHEDRAAFSLERLDHIADLGHAARIQSRSGLVEYEEFGLIQERLRDREALLHSLRELLDPV